VSLTMTTRWRWIAALKHRPAALTDLERELRRNQDHWPRPRIPSVPEIFEESCDPQPIRRSQASEAKQAANAHHHSVKGP